jgi:NAD(P)-dependent dehydrogenase (short-subunit alcohol dehydrogenase family)
MSNGTQLNFKGQIMSKKLTGKVAIVTGSSKGIGASIAKHLAAEGAAVVVNYSSSRTDADRVVAEITGLGGKAVAVQANVGKRPTSVVCFLKRRPRSERSTFSSTTLASMSLLRWRA